MDLLYTPYSFSYIHPGFSGLLFETSSGGLGFILVIVSTSVLINGHKDFVLFLMSLFILIPTSTAQPERF